MWQIVFTVAFWLTSSFQAEKVQVVNMCPTIRRKMLFNEFFIESKFFLAVSIRFLVTQFCVLPKVRKNSSGRFS